MQSLSWFFDEYNVQNILFKYKYLINWFNVFLILNVFLLNNTTFYIKNTIMSELSNQLNSIKVLKMDPSTTTVKSQDASYHV